MMSPTNHDDLIQLSSFQVAIMALPLLGLAGVSWYLGLGLESPILVGTVRSFVQLSILGAFILDPIFRWGVERWFVVVGYVFAMIILSASEATKRSKYYFEGMFWYVLGILLLNVAWISLLAFVFVLKPSPVWDPQYVIPICGMILGNCINGISVGLNAMLTSMVESSREVELLLGFGANSYEACFRLLKESAGQGSLPQLNGMAIIGIISIPGMMTGQMLGGSSVIAAARYQILIIYLIATCCFGTIFMSQMIFALRICFDSRMVLRVDRLIKNDKKPNALQLLKQLHAFLGSFWHERRYRNSSFTTDVEEHAHLLPRAGSQQLQITVAKDSDTQSQNALKVSGLTYSIRKSKATNSSDSMEEGKNGGEFGIFSGEETRWVVFENISMIIRPGGVAVVHGPSGSGKSTVLRVLAGLTQLPDEGTIQLFGHSMESYTNMAKWRRKILYVPQTKVDIPGSPHDLIIKIAKFHVRVTEDTLSFMKLNTARLTAEWGMRADLLDAEWKSLSGGEAQRVLVALSLASLPKIIMLDESTSGVDADSVSKVEKSIKDYCEQYGIAAIWITHDQGQKNRLLSNS